MGYTDVALKGAEIFNIALLSWCRTTGKGFSVETLRPVLKNTELKGLRYAPKLEGDVVQLSTKKLNETLPEYLYHFTTKANYENMLKSGFVDITMREPTNGIFFHTAENFKQAYKSLGTKFCPDGRLDWLRYPLREGGEAVVLKIPRNMLNQSKLHVRDERAFHCLDKDLPDTLHYIGQYIIQRKSNPNLTSEQFLATIPEKYREYFRGKPIYDYTTYDSNIPLAIVYEEKIPIDKFMVCARFNRTEYDSVKEVESFINKIF